jgi:hypothetical protein
MRDCKSRKRSTDFNVNINAYSAKRFPGIISSVYEIGPMGKNILAYEEAITLQEAVNRCGCRRKVVVCKTRRHMRECKQTSSSIHSSARN